MSKPVLSAQNHNVCDAVSDDDRPHIGLAIVYIRKTVDGKYLIIFSRKVSINKSCVYD